MSAVLQEPTILLGTAGGAAWRRRGVALGAGLVVSVATHLAIALVFAGLHVAPLLRGSSSPTGAEVIHLVLSGRDAGSSHAKAQKLKDGSEWRGNPASPKRGAHASPKLGNVRQDHATPVRQRRTGARPTLPGRRKSGRSTATPIRPFPTSGRGLDTAVSALNRSAREGPTSATSVPQPPRQSPSPSSAPPRASTGGGARLLRKTANAPEDRREGKLNGGANHRHESPPEESTAHRQAWGHEQSHVEARMPAGGARRHAAGESAALGSGRSSADDRHALLTGRRTAYAGRVRRLLQAALRYPIQARRFGLQGVVNVFFKVDAHGRVHGVHVIKSSGIAVLDASARRLVSGIGPLPPPPGGDISLTFDVRYRLDAGS